jgi:putative sterol carrier protein
VDPASEFFERVNERGYEPLLERVSGSVRFDLRRGRKVDRWRLTIDRGNMRAAQDGSDADCVVITDSPTFEGMVGGTTNPMAALLRGTVELYGRMDLLAQLQRLFPGPPNQHGPLKHTHQGDES